MKKGYYCELKTEGFHLRVVVFTNDESEVASIALQKAIALMKQVHGLAKTASDFKVTSIKPINLLKRKDSMPE